MQETFLNIPIWGIAKGFYLFGFFVYIVFAVVVVRQTQLMTKTLSVGFEAPIKFLSYALLALAIIVFLLSVAVL